MPGMPQMVTEGAGSLRGAPAFRPAIGRDRLQKGVCDAELHVRRLSEEMNALT